MITTQDKLRSGGLTNVRSNTTDRIPNASRCRLCGRNRGYVKMTFTDVMVYVTFVVVVVIWFEIKGIDQ